MEPEIASKLATDVVVGDKVSIDLGYGPRSDDVYLPVLRIEERDGLFGDPELVFHFSYQGEDFGCSFSPTNTVTVEVPPPKQPRRPKLEVHEVVL